MWDVSVTGYFEVWLGLILVGYLVAHLVDFGRAQAQTWKITEEQLCRCNDCKFAFIIPRYETAGRCPRCRKLCRIRLPM